MGTPTYDYWTMDNFGNIIGGHASVQDNITDITVLNEAPNGSFEIINATIDGVYNVILSSELAPTARVER